MAKKHKFFAFVHHHKNATEMSVIRLFAILKEITNSTLSETLQLVHGLFILVDYHRHALPVVSQLIVGFHANFEPRRQHFVGLLDPNSP